MEDNLAKMIEKLKKLSEDLESIKLADIVVDKKRRSAHFVFLCEKTVGEELESAILSVVNEYVPDGFLGVTIGVEKRVADRDLVVHTVYKYLKETQNAVAAEFGESDVDADLSAPIKRYTLRVSPAVAALFEKGKVIAGCDAYLERNFCGEFRGGLSVEKADEFTAPTEHNTVNFQIQPVRIRSFFVKDVIPLDDKNIPKQAVYMEDIAFPVEGAVHAGKILSVTERLTQKNKPYFVIEFSDTTKTVRALYFSRKTTVDRVRLLKEGDAVLTVGKYEDYKGTLRYTISKLNLCTFPEDFKPLPKEKRRPAPEYTRVFPKTVTSFRQKRLFDAEEEVPECLAGTDIVIFDLETTGKVASMDAITEIGAVRIKNGRIAEGFSTFVNPERHIPEDITEKTTISDETVKDAPKFSEVAGDFYKFTDGAVLVAHNAAFDVGFIRFHGREAGYVFDNPYMDTLELSRELLPTLPNHKLETVCEHFHIEFQHHRAVYDALGTAELFLELINMKKRLPNPKL